MKIMYLKQMLKMGRLILNKNENKINSVSEWDIINDLNWYKITKENDCENSIEIVKTLLIDNLSLESIQSIFEFVLNKRILLQNKIKSYIKTLNSEALNSSKYKKFKDDEFIWDFCSHVVGLGENMYNLVIDNIDIITILQRDVCTNFEFGFSEAETVKQQEL